MPRNLTAKQVVESQDSSLDKADEYRSQMFSKNDESCNYSSITRRICIQD